MNIYNNTLDSAAIARQMEEWVLESCFLDLLADEEMPNDLDDWALQRGWSSIVTRARDRVGKVSLNAEGNWWPSLDWRSLPKFNDAVETANWFLDMKASRVNASLQCNESSLNYACSAGTYANGTEEEKRSDVCREQEVYGKTLDAILLDSLAAFATVQREAAPPMSQEVVLSALIHSEICASATTADVSYGMARAFKNFFRKEDLHWYWLFHLVSTHNQARGWSHQRNYVECIHLLEPQLANFGSNFEEEDRKYFQLAERLTFSPAIFTLSDALHDCQRNTEAAWWIRYALRNPSSRYWEARLNIELSFFDEERVADVPLANTKPRLMNKKKQAEFFKNERLIAECQQNQIDCFDYASKWAEALTWTIRWHEGDPYNLATTIKRAAQGIHTVTEALKVRLKKDDKNDKMDFNLCFNEVRKVLERLREAIKSNTKTNKGIVFQFLSPQDGVIDIDRPFKLRESMNIWDAIKVLIPALESMVDFLVLMEKKKLIQSADSAKSDLEKWREKLRQRLREAWKHRHFAEIAADQQVIDILGNESTLCSSDKRGKTNCPHKPNCATTTLLLGDPKSSSDDRTPKLLPIGDTDRKRNVPISSTDYLLTRMSRTDSEFTRFLEFGSLEHANGSKDPITPWTEFISLRRWNSFSPNLASRATTTVGGGYLVRIWNRTAEKYVGIAIDPGYNYLENLFDEGFTLPDIDVIVITHAHPDHVENLSNILTLLRERKSRLKKISRVFLVLTEGVFQRFKALFENEVEFIEDVVVLSWAKHSKRNTVNVILRRSTPVDGRPIGLMMGNKEEASSPLVSIKAVPAIHADGTQYDSMGVVLHVPRQGVSDLCIGFTGDTRYSEELCITDSFADCDVLIPHLGSVIGRDAFSKLHEKWRRCEHTERVDKAVDELQPTLTNKNHLYLPGITMFLCKLTETMTKEKKSPLILLSEFGEELRGGLRADLAERLRQVFGLTVLPADVGLRVGVEDKSVRCVICRQYASAEFIHSVPVSDEDEALMFVCAHCYNARQHELPILLCRLRNEPHEYHSTNQS